ncbi:unnamed protein product, partial [Porites lobata]
MATSMFQICLDHLNCVVLILTCGSSLVVQGCVTAADCSVSQVCCDDDCVDGSSCVGHDKHVHLTVLAEKSAPEEKAVVVESASMEVSVLGHPVRRTP